VATDCSSHQPRVGGLGAFIDDSRILVDGSAREQEGFETGLGAWSVLGPPAGSPAAGGDFQRAQGLLFSAVTTEDSVLFGFGIEQIVSPAECAAVLGKAMEHLLTSRSEDVEVGQKRSSAGGHCVGVAAGPSHRVCHRCPAPSTATPRS